LGAGLAACQEFQAGQVCWRWSLEAQVGVGGGDVLMMATRQRQ
jgi:hypothetical protein